MDLISVLTARSGRTTPHLQTEVPAGTTETVRYEVPADATIERITLWAVPGSEDALELRPLIINQQGNETDAIPYGSGERFVTGEPAGDEFVLSEEVNEKEQIAIEATNASSQYAYRFRAKFELDYAGGGERVLGAAKGVLR